MAMDVEGAGEVPAVCIKDDKRDEGDRWLSFEIA